MKLRRLYNWFFRHSLYVIADATDNSITISKRLFKHMRVMEQEKAQAYVFRLRTEQGLGDYAFILNPELGTLEEPTQLNEIQYNSKHKCIGFETLVPTVNRIFYDYRLPHNAKCRLSVRVGVTPNGVTYYQICCPRKRAI